MRTTLVSSLLLLLSACGQDAPTQAEPDWVTLKAEADERRRSDEDRGKHAKGREGKPKGKDAKGRDGRGKEAKGRDAKGKGKDPKRRERATPKPRQVILSEDAGPPMLVLMIVVDTVRADHLSACGYDRPTSPILDALVKERGATLSCNAYSPAPWTLPSHGSFFTGQLVHEHGLALAPESALELNRAVNVRPLEPDVETLAEIFSERGYQTLFLSGNPIVKAETGLHQGFDIALAAEPQGGGMRGRDLADTLKGLVEQLDPSRPVFAFVNIYDAHDPYPAVPRGVDWLPVREEVRISPTKTEDSNTFFKFHEGRLSPKESRKWLDHVRDSYDYGVHEADRNIGRVMHVFRENGFSDEGVRMVITADHGELLGEHGLMRHGGNLHEGVVRVPFLLLDNRSEKPPLPYRFSAVQVFSLLAHGALDPERIAPAALSTPNPSFFQSGAASVATWDHDDKAVWSDGERWRHDLAADPSEDVKLEIPDGEMSDRLLELEVGFAEMSDLPVPSNENLTEALRAMGYLE